MKNVVILISGRGSNMQAIVKARLPNTRIAAVISNRPKAAGLAWAAARGIPTLTVDHNAFDSREAFEDKLAEAIDHFDADLLVLAGFMRILTPSFTQRYEGRAMNIHPSLLPAFTGIHTHQRVLATGCKIAGCTVHFVTAELDHGPIVAQGVVPVADEDTSDSLAARILAVEHRLYPAAIRWFIEGRLSIIGGKVLLSNAHSIDDSSFIVPTAEL